MATQVIVVVGIVRMIGANRRVPEVVESKLYSLVGCTKIDIVALMVRRMLTFDCRVEDRAIESRLVDTEGKRWVERHTSLCREDRCCSSSLLHPEHEMAQIAKTDTWYSLDAVVHIHHISTGCRYWPYALPANGRNT